MSVTSHRTGLFFAAVLASCALSGCADVRQNPASNIVNGQADAIAQQDVASPSGPAAATITSQQTSPTNIPF
jgi:hypothetical protein